MAYTNNRPIATDRISASQAVLLDDFIAIDTGWLTNHVDLNLPNTGKHHYVTLPNNTFLAGVFPYETLPNEVALYSESGNLYFRPTGQAVGVHTNDRNLTDTTGSTTPNGWIRLANGILIKWGQASSNNTGVQNITYPVGVGIPAFTHVYSVQLSIMDTDGDTIVYLVSYAATTATFSVRSKDVRTGGHNKAATFTYLAIGI